MRTPRDLKATAEIQSLGADVEHVQVQSVGPLRFEIADQVLTIEELHLAGSGTDFTAEGKAHLSGAQELDVHMDGSVNMTLFQSLNPKILARGTLGVNLNASGTLAQPVLQGRIDVKNTFLSHNDFPSGLSDLNGVLLFDRNRIQIENLSGTTGGGTIALTGSANYQERCLPTRFRRNRARRSPALSSGRKFHCERGSSADRHYECRGAQRRCSGHQIGRYSGIRLRRLYRKEPAVSRFHAER